MYFRKYLVLNTVLLPYIKDIPYFMGISNNRRVHFLYQFVHLERNLLIINCILHN